ncbi:MAG TPA: hypothetical protein VF155_08665 [Candidatus Dormibacteraeota bacterium]
MSGDPWFVRRRFGYGWRPVAWQGWVVTAFFIAAVITAVVVSRLARSFLGYVIGIALLAVFYVIATLTARTPDDRPG